MILRTAKETWIIWCHLGNNQTYSGDVKELIQTKDVARRFLLRDEYRDTHLNVLKPYF